ncbi:MAG TPA: hypothetical protein VGB52_11995 [Actinomycetota bacterium]
MPRPAIRRLCAAAAIVLALTTAPSAAAIGPACTTQHTPMRIQVGDALSQTFTPPNGSIARYDVKLFFRRSFSGTIASRLQINVPIEHASYEVALRGIELAGSTASVSGGANTTAWVTFRFDPPVEFPVTPDGPMLEIELRPGGSNPAWAWVRCASTYAGGRAYGRAPIRQDDTVVPNEALKFPLSPTADLQFRVYSG